MRDALIGALGSATQDDGIPVTTVARTLLDLAEVIQPRRLAVAFDQAERLGRLDMRALRRAYERCRGRRGLRPLAALLSEAEGPPDTRSALERRFVDLCRSQNLPRPLLNSSVTAFVTRGFSSPGTACYGSRTAAHSRSPRLSQRPCARCWREDRPERAAGRPI